MDIVGKACRLCLSETDFNIPIHSTYCRKTKMIDKILVCLKIFIEETDSTSTICYQCANNVEKYYEFLQLVKTAQAKQTNGNFEHQKCSEYSMNQTNRRVTSYVQEQVFDPDSTFSFLEIPKKNKEPASSPFFSYFSPPNNEHLWKPTRPAQNTKIGDYKMPQKTTSRDMFESQSQEVDEPDMKSFSWKLSPDDNIIKRVKNKFFGRSDF